MNEKLNPFCRLARANTAWKWYFVIKKAKIFRPNDDDHIKSELLLLCELTRVINFVLLKGKNERGREFTENIRFCTSIQCRTNPWQRDLCPETIQQHFSTLLKKKLNFENVNRKKSIKGKLRYYKWYIKVFRTHFCIDLIRLNLFWYI